MHPFCTLFVCTPFAYLFAPSLFPETHIKWGITDREKRKGVHRECGEMWSICTQKSMEKYGRKVGKSWNNLHTKNDGKVWKNEDKI